jgi:2-oxoacid:acceptor oxidoreductase delta subunit (pyruvate/2-ketoisovalerate family)
VRLQFIKEDLKLVKKENTWEKKTITGRMNSVRLSEVYGENWEEDVVKDSISRNMASWRVFIPIIDYNECKKCWLCYNYCPEGVIYKKEEGPGINKKLCKGCGICSTECSFGAIKMVRE